MPAAPVSAGTSCVPRAADGEEEAGTGRGALKSPKVDIQLRGRPMAELILGVVGTRVVGDWLRARSEERGTNGVEVGRETDGRREEEDPWEDATEGVRERGGGSGTSEEGVPRSMSVESASRKIDDTELSSSVFDFSHPMGSSSWARISSRIRFSCRCARPTAPSTILKHTELEGNADDEAMSGPGRRNGFSLDVPAGKPEYEYGISFPSATCSVVSTSSNAINCVECVESSSSGKADTVVVDCNKSSTVRRHGIRH